MKYKQVGGRKTTDTIDIQGFFTNYDSCQAGQWQPFELCVYGLVDPRLHPVKFMEQIDDYIDSALYELRKLQ